MGTLILVSGENNSGKSAFAEKIVSNIKGDRFYIATMIPQTDENHMRIEKHRSQRSGLGFYTLELPYAVGNAPVTQESAVLLEDISNLVANNIFEKGSDENFVFQDICKLLKRCGMVVAVTISGLNGNGYDEETSRYIDSLNKINKMLFDTADIAVSMQDKTPVYEKGEPYDFV